VTDTERARVRFEGSQPILRVEDMDASLRFYVGLLGFENATWGNGDFTSVSRDAAAIYLCRGGQGLGGAWVWIGAEDVEKLHNEFLTHDVPSVCRRRISCGRLKCTLRIPAGMCSASGQSPPQNNNVHVPCILDAWRH
jgi:hypothetical protein